jgi:hypothetical protein
MQAISIIIGILCAMLMVPGLIPFLGWVQWLVLAGCTLGIIFGAFGPKKTGLIINGMVAVVAALRLLIGGGFV